MAFQVTNPFPNFTDLAGLPLENGKLFIGTVNLNPEGNAIQVFYDDALTIPAAQPIRTLAGYPSRDGNPSDIFVAETSYSITVRDKNDAFVFSDITVVEVDTTGVITVNAGSNINITGPASDPIVNVDLSPTFVDLTASGNLKGKTVDNSTSSNLNLTRNAHANEFIRSTSGSALTLTITNNAGAWIAGDMILVVQQGSGQVTVAVEGGVGFSLGVPADKNPKTKNQFSAIAIIATGPNSFIVDGSLETA